MLFRVKRLKSARRTRRNSADAKIVLPLPQVDEFQMKVGELERAERSLRTLQVGNVQESSELKAKLQHSGHAHKAELAAIRSEYEGKLEILGSEVDSMQGQIISLAKERDSLREQLEDAAKVGHQLNRDTADQKRKGYFGFIVQIW